MTDDQTPSNDRIAAEALGKTLSRLFSGPSPEEIAAHLSQTMNSALRVADSGTRPIIIGQINVLKVTHNWIARLAEDPDDVMRVDQAIREIQDAIFAGLRGERYV